MISISHDLELIYARGEGEKGRGGKGRGKGEKKRGGEKESFLHFRGLPTPTSVQLPHCNAFQRESRGEGGEKERKREEKGGKRGEKRGKRRGKGRGKRKRPHLRPLKIFRGLRPRPPPSAGGAAPPQTPPDSLPCRAARRESRQNTVLSRFLITTKVVGLASGWWQPPSRPALGPARPAAAGEG